MQHRHVLLCILGVGCLGLILYIAGFATPEWYKDGGLTIGYWGICVGGDCREMNNMELGYTSAQLITGRVFEFLGILTAAGGLVVVFLRTVQPSVYSNVKAYRASVFLLATAGCWGLGGVISICGFSFCVPHGGYSLALNISGSCTLILWAIVAYFTKPEVTVPAVREVTLSLI